MKNKDLVAAGGIWAYYELSKGEKASLDVLIKVYKVKGCDFCDIMEIVSDEEKRAASELTPSKWSIGI